MYGRVKYTAPIQGGKGNFITSNLANIYDQQKRINTIFTVLIIKKLFMDFLTFPAKRLTHHFLYYIHPLFTHLRETLCHVDFTVSPPRSVKFVQGNIGPRSTPSVTENTYKFNMEPRNY